MDTVGRDLILEKEFIRNMETPKILEEYEFNGKVIRRTMKRKVHDFKSEKGKVYYHIQETKVTEVKEPNGEFEEEGSVTSSYYCDINGKELKDGNDRKGDMKDSITGLLISVIFIAVVLLVIKYI